MCTTKLVRFKALSPKTAAYKTNISQQCPNFECMLLCFPPTNDAIYVAFPFVQLNFTSASVLAIH